MNLKYTQLKKYFLIFHNNLKYPEKNLKKLLKWEHKQMLKL